MYLASKWWMRPAGNAVIANRHNIVVSVNQQRLQCCISALPLDQHRMCADVGDCDVRTIEEAAVCVHKVLFSRLEDAKFGWADIVLITWAAHGLKLQECLQALDGCISALKRACIWLCVIKTTAKVVDSCHDDVAWYQVCFVAMAYMSKASWQGLM